MKNKIKKNIIIILFFSVFVITGCNNNSEINKNTIIKTDINKENTIKNNKQEKIKKELNSFKNTVAAKGLIISGDIHLQNDEFLFALKKFLEANKKTPNNPKVLSKIAETYFLMKNYKLAYKYYSKIADETFLDKNKKTLSFLYSQKIEDYNFIKNSSGALNSSGSLFLSEIKNKIKNNNLNKDQEFYYLNSLECINSFHNCKLNYENYFKNTEYSAKNKNLENIRTAIDNYKKLKLDELYYKDALIIGALLQNQNYPISIVLSKELLKQKNNYKPLLKIIAQSYFEINNLTKASKYLLEYAKIDSKSPDVSYMIGVISQKKKDYLKSNIFLNLAQEQGYNDLESIYRLQLYNYLILGETAKISKTFDKIIAIQKIPKFNDLTLGVYYNIINNNLEKAGLLANMGIKNYPKKEDFYGFKAWILIEKLDYKQAEELLEKASKINPRNALITLNLGRIYKLKYNQDQNIFHKAKAKLLFKKTIDFDSAEIGVLAEKYLKELEEENKSVE